MNREQRFRVVERGLDLRLQAKFAKRCLKWGSVNVVLLAVLLFDISNKCPYAKSNWYVAEYALAILVGLSMIACFWKYFLYIFDTEPIKGTKEQKNLLKFDENDKTFITCLPAKKKDGSEEAATQQVNSTMLSGHSSFNDSRAAASHNWGYSRYTPPPRHSPQQQQQQQQQQQCLPNTSWNSSLFDNSALSSSASFMSSFLKYKHEDNIDNEESLKQYLRDVAKREQKMNEIPDMSQILNTGSINSFWNYCNSAASLLKTSFYQLAPSTTTSAPNKPTANEQGFLNITDSNSEVIKRISSEKLSKYVANLRMWISATIFQRLAREIESIDESFINRGLIDMQIGSIGLERLKKTADNQQFVSQCMPMLPLIVPFLEMSSNQEYLVQRIKDLAKGSCIADYRWNSGSEYHGLKWDEHLPTDSAILFHLFCVYLDSQLMPLPQGGGRPFYHRYVIMGEDKRSAKETIAAVQNKAHCAILCTNPLKPKFNFISDGKIHNCTYDRNNLFYVIIQFLIYMRTYQESSLEGVNLGRSGINIMCVIED